MTSALPALLTPAHLPFAELQSAALDGDVFRVDRAFCSVAEFDVPWRRALALSEPFGEEFVVAGRSAAWVWGALALAPLTHDAYGETRKGSHDVPTGMAVRAMHPLDADLIDFGGVRVTTPLRTVVDLVRGDAFEESDAGTVRFLADEHSVDRASCEAVMERHKNLPHKRRARQRLDACGLVRG